MATSKVIFTEEVVKIPTYQEGKTENLPMFAENRVHQRTSGNPFPKKQFQKLIVKKEQKKNTRC